MFRAAAAFVLIGTIAVSAVYRRQARRKGGTIRRRDEKPQLILLRLAVALPLLGSVLGHLIAPGVMSWATYSAPVLLNWIGVVGGLSCIPLAVWVFRSIGSNISETVLTKEEHRLVSWGPYRWVRHPLYTTGFLLFGSVGLLTNSWLILGFAVLIAVLVSRFVIPDEEANLTSVFGEAYESMISTTGRFLPRW